MEKPQLTPNITAERIKEYLKQDKRFDGRKPLEFRDISIETNVSKNAEGSSRVKIGKTEVLVGIKMKIGEPYPDSADSGNMMVTAELLPLSSPRFENGPPRFPAIELGRLTDRLIRESKFIDTKGLCIKEGEKVWTVFIDVYSINDDGNLLDAAAIGAITALRSARIPEYDEENDKVLFGKLTDKKLPLKKEILFPKTFHKIGDKFIVDPTREEEDVSETRLTIGSSDGIIYSMQKGNSQSLTIEEMHLLLDSNKEVEKELSEKIGKFLK